MGFSTKARRGRRRRARARRDHHNVGATQDPLVRARRAAFRRSRATARYPSLAEGGMV